MRIASTLRDSGKNNSSTLAGEKIHYRKSAKFAFVAALDFLSIRMFSADDFYRNTEYSALSFLYRSFLYRQYFH